jgi:hypothetical protein
MLTSEHFIDKRLELSLEIQPDKLAGKRSPSSRLFSHASGDWKAVLHKDSWWVVGHHLAYPARDRYDAQRLLQELSQQYKRSQGGK